MLQPNGIDEETECLFTHLRDLANGETVEDPTLVDGFTLGINYHQPSIYSFSDHASTSNPVIKKLVSLLLSVAATASEPYSHLLEQLLKPLSFEEICKYIPRETILISSRIPATRSFTLNILKRKVASEEGAVSFLVESDLIYNIVADLVQEEEESLEVIEVIAQIISSIDKALLSVEKFDFLADLSEEQILHPDHFSKYLSIISALAPLDFSEVSWGPQLFQFTFSKVKAFDDLQPRSGWVSLLTNTYVSWIGRVRFSWLKPYIASLMDFVVLNRFDLLSVEAADEFVSAYQSFFIALFNHPEGPLEFALEFLSRPEADIVDKNDPSSVFFFARIPLHNVAGKREFFKKHFEDMDVKAGGQFAEGCLYALVQDEGFFDLLVEFGTLTESNIKNWQKDSLFYLLTLLSRFEYSARFMIANFSSIISTHLITVDRTMINQDIWQNKLRTLRALLMNRNIDLGIWKTDLSSCLYEMENGRRFADLEPQVGIMHK